MKVKKLLFYGQRWFSSVKILKGGDVRFVACSCINEITTELERHGLDYITLRTSPFQPTELLVCLDGEALKYRTIVNAISNVPGTALWVARFLNSNIKIRNFTGFNFSRDIEKKLQCFVAIVSLAEVGRGYLNACKAVCDFAIEVYAGNHTWADIFDEIPFVTTYAQDEKTNWTPDSTLSFGL